MRSTEDWLCARGIHWLMLFGDSHVEHSAVLNVLSAVQPKKLFSHWKIEIFLWNLDCTWTTPRKAMFITYELKFKLNCWPNCHQWVQQKLQVVTKDSFQPVIRSMGRTLSPALANWTLLEIYGKFPCKRNFFWHCGASRNTVFECHEEEVLFVMYSLALYCELFYSSHIQKLYSVIWLLALFEIMAHATSKRVIRMRFIAQYITGPQYTLALTRDGKILFWPQHRLNFMQECISSKLFKLLEVQIIFSGIFWVAHLKHLQQSKWY